jgi:hypothetical protein
LAGYVNVAIGRSSPLDFPAPGSRRLQSRLLKIRCGRFP